MAAATLAAAAVSPWSSGLSLALLAAALTGFAVASVDPLAVGIVTVAACLIVPGPLADQIGELAGTGTWLVLAGAAVAGLQVGWVRRVVRGPRPD